MENGKIRGCQNSEPSAPIEIKFDIGTKIDLGPGHIVFDGVPAPPKKYAYTHPNFRPMSVVAKRLDGSRCHLIRSYIRLGPGDIALDMD